MLAIAILGMTSNVNGAIDKSLTAARKYPFFSVRVQTVTSGLDLMQGSCWQLARRSKSWAEIDISNSSMDPTPVRGVYELKDGLLTVYWVSKKLFSRRVVQVEGDALAQLFKILAAKERPFEDSEQGTEIVCSSDALAAFLGHYEKLVHWNRRVEKKWVSYEHTAGSNETLLGFDSRTGRLTFWRNGPHVQGRGDSSFISYEFGPASAIPELKLPQDATRVADLGRVSRKYWTGTDDST